MSTKFGKLILPEQVLSLPKRGYNTNSAIFCVDLTFGWYKMPWYSLCSFFFRITVRKRCLDESGFRHCYGNFFESVILKVT